MLRVGIHRTRARWSWASATQTLACAMATMIGRASASRSAVARLIGKRRSWGSVGASGRFGNRARDSTGWDGVAGWSDRAAGARPVVVVGGSCGPAWLGVGPPGACTGPVAAPPGAAGRAEGAGGAAPAEFPAPAGTAEGGGWARHTSGSGPT